MSTTKRTQPATRKPRRARRALAESDDEVERLAHSSDSDHSSSNSDASDSDDTASSSDDDELETPAAPATATDHSVSPPSKRSNRKSRKPAAAAGSADVPSIVAPSLIPGQTDWSDLVAQDDAIQASNPPIVDFADFISNGIDGIPDAGPSSTEPSSVRGRSKPRGGGGGGKTQRQAYLDRLTEDPSFIPRVGAFWGHDERLLAPELRGMSEWWRGRWSGRGRGGPRGRGRGGAQAQNRDRAPALDAEPTEPKSESQAQQSRAPSPPPIERTWGHDGFEKMREQEHSHLVRGRGRGRASGRGGRGSGRSTLVREPEQLWTKAPDTHLHIDPSTRPQFPGQGRGIKVNIPGQWRPSIVRLPRSATSNSTPAPKTTSSVTTATEIVVKLPGQQAKVVPVPAKREMKPALPEDPVTVLPLQDAPRPVVARLPARTLQPSSTEIASAPPPTSSTSGGSATTDAPLRSTTAVPAPIPAQGPSKLASRVPAHGRTRSQLDAVAFARTAVPTTESAPLAFGSLPTPGAPVPAPETAPPPVPAQGDMPALAITVPAPIVQALPNPVASYTPPPVSAYTPHGHNPYAYAYTPLDGAAYYSTATPPPPQHMYYPQNTFFAPPRPSGPVSIRAPGESVGAAGMEESRPAGGVPAPPMWNYYSHPHSHSQSHNSYYSPSGTPYPPPPPPRGYYSHGGEYPAHAHAHAHAQPSDYPGMYDGYAPGAHVYY